MAVSAGKSVSEKQVLLGDEAVALAAIHAGVSGAYGYPGTPSTEILEFMHAHASRHASPRVVWNVNEKTAFEHALGVSIVGRRALVAMKHVGLNVAADPFMNAAVVDIQGGLVVVVADDPGMHSSQNEQDSRYYVNFARTICLEPSDQQEAYQMTREAFDLSEKFHQPIVIRLVTRLAHSRTMVETFAPRGENDLKKPDDMSTWTLLPVNARRQWKKKLAVHPAMHEFTDSCAFNQLDERGSKLGVITNGIAKNYFCEVRGRLDSQPSHLHIGAYPLPVKKIRALADNIDELLVLEEGYPFIEERIRGVLPGPLKIRGKMNGDVPEDGELDPDIVARALGLSAIEPTEAAAIPIPPRPPQLCPGCPHDNAYVALNDALKPYTRSYVASDIGCYTLGALPPFNAIESCVCMGASVGMAKGASEAGFFPVVAVIGDSTFLHSGVTPLIDAVASDANMVLLILDNEAVAMTGAQTTVLPSTRLAELILGMGVPKEHFHVIDAHPKKIGELSGIISRELEHPGLSVIVAVRECLEWVKRQKKAK